MARVLDRKETKERLAKEIQACADEIAAHGLEALWDDNEFVTGGHIHIDISADMNARIRFTRDVLPMVKEW